MFVFKHRKGGMIPTQSLSIFFGGCPSLIYPCRNPHFHHDEWWIQVELKPEEPPEIWWLSKLDHPFPQQMERHFFWPATSRGAKTGKQTRKKDDEAKIGCTIGWDGLKQLGIAQDWWSPQLEARVFRHWFRFLGVGAICPWSISWGAFFHRSSPNSAFCVGSLGAGELYHHHASEHPEQIL